MNLWLEQGKVLRFSFAQAITGLQDSNRGNFPCCCLQIWSYIANLDSRLLDSNRGNFPCSNLPKLSLAYRTRTGEMSSVLVKAIGNIYMVNISIEWLDWNGGNFPVLICTIGNISCFLILGYWTRTGEISPVLRCTWVTGLKQGQGKFPLFLFAQAITGYMTQSGKISPVLVCTIGYILLILIIGCWTRTGGNFPCS